MPRTIPSVFLLLIFSLVLPAQTATAVTGVTPSQVKGAPSSSGLLWVVLPNGTIAQADIGAGLILDLSGLRPVLRAVAAPTNRRVYNEVLTPAGAGNRVCTLQNAPAAGTLQLYQNGIRQREGSDYTVTGATVTFVAYYGDLLASGAKITADYEVTP